MNSTAYIDALNHLQSACAKMFAKANLFKYAHLLNGSDQIFNLDEWADGANSLAEGIDELRKSVNEVCEQFCINIGGQ